MAQHRMSNASGNKVAGRLVACFLDGLHNKLELLTGIAVRGKAAYIGDKRGMTAYFLNEDALEGVVTLRIDAQRCAKVSAHASRTVNPRKASLLPACEPSFTTAKQGTGRMTWFRLPARSPKGSHNGTPLARPQPWRRQGTHQRLCLAPSLHYSGRR